MWLLAALAACACAHVRSEGTPIAKIALDCDLTRRCNLELSGRQEPIPTHSASNNLISNLRRQLTRDNSDYSHEAPTLAEGSRRLTPERGALQRIAHNYYVTKTNHQSDRYHASSADDERRDEGTEQPVAERDLLYYIDDEKFITKIPEDRKYRTLKVHRQFRRSGRQQYIQEEGVGGVAIVSLGGAPFPELRLPRARRQYQQQRGDIAADELELLPPPADHGDRDVQEDITQLAADDGDRKHAAEDRVQEPTLSTADDVDSTDTIDIQATTLMAGDHGDNRVAVTADDSDRKHAAKGREQESTQSAADDVDSTDTIDVQATTLTAGDHGGNRDDVNI